MNIAIIVGRVTKDPVIRYTGDQKAIASFTVAVDRPTKEKETDFIQCTAFGKQAETIELYVKTGKQVAVEGSIRTGSYTNKDGVKVYTTEVSANRVEFLGGKSDSAPAPKPDELPAGMTYAEVDDIDIPFA